MMYIIVIIVILVIVVVIVIIVIIVIIVTFVIIVIIVIITITHSDVYIYRHYVCSTHISSHLKCDQSSNGHSGREGVHLRHTIWSHNLLTEKTKSPNVWGRNK